MTVLTIVVAWGSTPLADEPVHVVAKLRGSLSRRRGRVDRNVELVHLHHPVRPVEEVAMAVERDPQHATDDGDRVRLRIVVQELHLTGRSQRLQELACELTSRFA